MGKSVRCKASEGTVAEDAHMPASPEKTDSAARRSTRSIVSQTALVTLVFIGVAYLVLTSKSAQVYLYPPRGQIAERLAAVDPHPQLTTETDVLSYLYPAGTPIHLGAKGPKGILKTQLQDARFRCSTFMPTPTSRGVQVCRNDAAGYNANGCLRQWLILIEIPRGGDWTPIVERIRSFVRSDC